MEMLVFSINGTSVVTKSLLKSLLVSIFIDFIVKFSHVLYFRASDNSFELQTQLHFSVYYMNLIFFSILFKTQVIDEHNDWLQVGSFKCIFFMLSISNSISVEHINLLTFFIYKSNVQPKSVFIFIK